MLPFSFLRCRRAFSCACYSCRATGFSLIFCLGFVFFNLAYSRLIFRTQSGNTTINLFVLILPTGLHFCFAGTTVSAPARSCFFSPWITVAALTRLRFCFTWTTVSAPAGLCFFFPWITVAAPTGLRFCFIWTTVSAPASSCFFFPCVLTRGEVPRSDWWVPTRSRQSMGVHS